MEENINDDKLIDNTNIDIKKEYTNNCYFDFSYCCFIFLSLIC